jgi:hypothetical protein
MRMCAHVFVQGACAHIDKYACERGVQEVCSGSVCIPV